MERGILINNKHSFHTFGCYMTSGIIEVPKRIEIIERIPYSNLEYDFSKIFGETFYEQRTLAYTFSFEEHDNLLLINRTQEIIEWLRNDYNLTKLQDDYFPEYFFNAKLKEASYTFDLNICDISVTFSADPYMKPLFPKPGLTEVI